MNFSNREPTLVWNSQMILSALKSQLLETNRLQMIFNELNFFLINRNKSHF